MTTNIKPTTIALGAGLVLGLFALTRSAKAANAATPARKALPQNTSTSTPPLLRSSTAEEGKPLAWDRAQHPLADRGLDENDAAAAALLSVVEVPLELETDNGLPFPPGMKVIDIDAPTRAKPANPLDRGVIGPKPSKPTPAAKPAEPSTPRTAAPATVLPTRTRSAEVAARALYDRASELVATGKGAQLGTKNAPSAFVRDAQADMGMQGRAADGIYGPATRAQGKHVLNKTFPVRK